jgi:hypothetical protein
VEHWLLILAGPIVRRVEPGLVSVWVALKEARQVRLMVWQGSQDAGAGDGLVTVEGPIAVGDTKTIRVGERLHVAVVTASPTGAFTAGQTFAYNVAFGAPEGGFSATEDLKSLGLLRDQPQTGEDETARLPHKALGYEANQLPTFVLPPPELADLRIAHGSCRRPHADTADMMPALDELIRTSRGEVKKRPQQLFLTGDQIYADDVAPALLHLLTPVGNELLGAVEHLPTRGTLQPSQGVRLEPAERSRFPAGVRKAVVMEDAKLTTVDGERHLLSLGEFLAMHLFVFANTLWPVKLPTYQDLFWGETLPLSEFDEVLAGIELPPDLWRVHTGLGFETEHGLKHRYKETEDLEGFQAIHVGRVLTKVAQDKKAEAAYAKEMKVIEAFRDALPQVRRVLANVATYTLCDDHEITDDLNLNAMWRDRVLTSPLGRTVLRNGFVAYAICQGWGNDPQQFAAEGSKQKALLDAIPKLFPAGEDLPPHTETSDQVDLLLGLDGSDPPVRWHYQVDGPKHRVLGLDVRTRRSFTSRASPPSNLSAAALKEQIPEGPLPAGLEVLFVLAGLPPFGLPVSDAFAGALLFRAFDAFHHSDIAGMPGTNPDAAEAWVHDPDTFEALLKRLAPYRKVIFLSGDVHYGHSGETSYWRKADEKPARFAQFTSSGVKNIWPHIVVTLSRSFAFGQAIERLGGPAELLGWDEGSPTPLKFPPDIDLLPPARSRLRREPLLLPTRGWPKGTTVERAPDWSWRFRLSRDQRPPNELPEPARFAPLDPEKPNDDIVVKIEGYRQVAQRHAKQLDRVSHTRQALFESNVGIVTFERKDGRLLARQELHAQPLGATTPAIYSMHEVVLEAAASDPAELKPTIPGGA